MSATASKCRGEIIGRVPIICINCRRAGKLCVLHPELTYACSGRSSKRFSWGSSIEELANVIKSTLTPRTKEKSTRGGIWPSIHTQKYR